MSAGSTTLLCAFTLQYGIGWTMFNPVNGKGMTGNVALQIEAAIMEGRLTPGEKIPSERDLQALFKTGRGVVREALRAPARPAAESGGVP